MPFPAPGASTQMPSTQNVPDFVTDGSISYWKPEMGLIDLNREAACITKKPEKQCKHITEEKQILVNTAI